VSPARTESAASSKKIRGSAGPIAAADESHGRGTVQAPGRGKRNGKGNGAQLEFGAIAERPDKRPDKRSARQAEAKPSKAPAPVAETLELMPSEPEPAKEAARGKRKSGRRLDAVAMATKQREISISEFFSKNRHLLGFDNPQKALLTTVREAVDNALDACEEAGILPRLDITIFEVNEDRYIVSVEDNGPGIVKAQLPKIFGKLLYGSKFHRLKQSRGQQGIGISAASMYGQLTTGRPVRITSKIGTGHESHRVELQIDTAKNQPVVVSDSVVTGDAHWDTVESGTLVEIELAASFKGGHHGVESYLRQTALANPHAEIHYLAPRKQPLHFPRVVAELPPEPNEIKPHPHGVEIGLLMRMLKEVRGRNMRQFLVQSFSRVSDKTAVAILERAQIAPSTSTAEVFREQQVEALYRAIQGTKLMAPPSSCLAPIGAESIQRAMLALVVASEQGGDGLDGEAVDQIVEQAEVDPEVGGMDTGGLFVTAVTRPPSVYRGNPFAVEVGIAYGKGLPADQLARVFRFANRVPLLYQASACSMTKSVLQTAWRNYDIQQSRGALPMAPLVIMLHIASAWVPYTSESKEAIAHYPEILKELKLALQEVGRRLAIHVRRRRRAADEEKKQRYIQKYIDPIGEALQEILKLSDKQVATTVETLRDVLEKSRKL